MSERTVILRVDDVERDLSLADTPGFDSNGKSYGCKIVDVAALNRESDDALSDSFSDADPVERVYAPSEQGALAAARRRAVAAGWTVVDDWSSLVPADAG